MTERMIIVVFSFSTLATVDKILDEKVGYFPLSFEGGGRFYMKKLTEQFHQPRALLRGNSNGSWTLYLPPHDWEIVRPHLQGLVTEVI